MLIPGVDDAAGLGVTTAGAVVVVVLLVVLVRLVLIDEDDVVVVLGAGQTGSGENVVELWPSVDAAALCELIAAKTPAPAPKPTAITKRSTRWNNPSPRELCIGA